MAGVVAALAVVLWLHDAARGSAVPRDDDLGQTAQEPLPLVTTRIADAPACPRCSTALAPVVTLGRAADGYAIRNGYYIAVDSRERSYVASPRGGVSPEAATGRLSPGR